MRVMKLLNPPYRRSLFGGAVFAIFVLAMWLSLHFVAWMIGGEVSLDW